MIGEIRDTETAQIAVKAAQTGHLVLATLHSRSASNAETRLLQLGVNQYSLATGIKTHDSPAFNPKTMPAMFGYRSNS